MSNLLKDLIWTVIRSNKRTQIFEKQLKDIQNKNRMETPSELKKKSVASYPSTGCMVEEAEESVN